MYREKRANTISRFSVLEKTDDNLMLSLAKLKAKNVQLESVYREAGLTGKADRLKACCCRVIVKRNIVGNSKIKDRNSCNIRLCPICADKQSSKYFSKMCKVIDRISAKKNYKFIFLTLTSKNVAGKDLSAEIVNLSKGFTNLTKRKDCRVVKGWFKSIEITYNSNLNSIDYNTFNPHIHAILVVNNSYLTDSKVFIKKEKWVSLWKSCMNLDYNPVVNLNRKVLDSKVDATTSVAAWAMYATKGYMHNLGRMPLAEEVRVLEKALRNKRLVEFYGILRSNNTNNKNLLTKKSTDSHDNLEGQTEAIDSKLNTMESNEEDTNSPREDVNEQPVNNNDSGSNENLLIDTTKISSANDSNCDSSLQKEYVMYYWCFAKKKYVYVGASNSLQGLKRYDVKYEQFPKR